MFHKMVFNKQLDPDQMQAEHDQGLHCQPWNYTENPSIVKTPT